MVMNFSKILSYLPWRGSESKEPSGPQAISVDSLGSYFSGEKFAGGLGFAYETELDYWSLRTHSANLFYRNPYARGLIRRLITNEVGTGLTPELMPDGAILGMDDDEVDDWTNNVESRFFIWSKSPRVCDPRGRDTYGAIQQAARLEALIAGDVLVLIERNSRTGTIAPRLIPGEQIQSPLASRIDVNLGNTIRHGIEFDSSNREVAYWVKQRDGTHRRLLARGRRSGRRMAWMVYGLGKRYDDIRGEPLLSLVLQSLRELDRYRDSMQRKAVVNSLLALFIERTDDKPSSLPLSGGAVRKDQVTTQDPFGGERKYSINQMTPGVVIEELGKGEKPVAFQGSGVDQEFTAFEEAIVSVIAWTSEVPPEILRLAFSNNYSASQAAINEFKIYLDKFWAYWGESFCGPVYEEWLLNEVVQGRIQADSLHKAWDDPTQHDVYGAWLLADWYGSIKPSTDMVKQGKGSQMLVDQGWSTNAREARVLTGTNYRRNIRQLRKENELKVLAQEPLLKAQQDAKPKTA